MLGINYTLRIYMTNITGIISFLLFHLILPLFTIFMVMINVVKIELINAAVNFPANILSAKIFCLLIKLCLAHPTIYIKYGQKHWIADLVVTKSLILLNEWELKVVLSTKRYSWNKFGIFFFGQKFPSSFAVWLMK